jgi:2,3-bisphosphoglycerate-dependent phosphoglycerate mutase
LKQAIERVIPYWRGTILPEIASGKKVLLVAHENVLRGIIKILDKISD